MKIREIADIVDISTDTKYLTRKIGHEKARKGAAVAHSGGKTESHDNFRALFGHV